MNICKEKYINSLPYNLNISQFKSLEPAIWESVLIFNNKLYKQVDRVTMDFPLGTLQKIAFFTLERLDWNYPKKLKPIVYKIYVE